MKSKEVDLRGAASGYRVAQSIRTIMYLYPPFPLGRGPTMAILSKGVDVRGIGCNGPPGLPFGCVSWQAGQLEQYSLTSLYIPGQYVLVRRHTTVAASSMCPSKGNHW